MLTEKGFDAALKLSSIPAVRRDSLRVKSYEVQKVVKKLVEATKPQDYNPFDISKKIVKTTTEFTLRDRGFRQAIVETYDVGALSADLKSNRRIHCRGKLRPHILFPIIFGAAMIYGTA